MKTRISLLMLTLVFFSISPTLAQQKPNCKNLSQLKFGQTAEVVEGKKLLVYAKPDMNSQVLGEYPDTFLSMNSGPNCESGFPWWPVKYDGVLAYINEYDGNTYNIVPYVAPTPSGVFPTSDTPIDPKIISIDNADQLVEQARFGSGWITDTDWSPDGQTFVVASSLGLRLYDAAKLDDKTTPSELLTTNIQINDVEFNPDGRLLAAVGEDGFLYVWNIQSRQLAYSLDLGSGSSAISFSPDGNWLAVSGVSEFPEQRGRDFGTWLLEARTGTKQSFVKDQEYALHIAFSDDSKRITLDNPYSSTVYHLSDANMLLPEKEYKYQYQSFTSWASSRDGKHIAVIQSFGGDGPIQQYITLLEPETHEDIINKDVSNEKDVDKVVFTPNADLLLSVDINGALTARSLETIKPLAVITGHAEVITFSVDGSLMATGGINGDVRIFTTPKLNANSQAQFKQLNVFYGIVGAVKSLLFSPDRSRIAAVGEDNTIRIWDISSAKLLVTYRDFTSPITSLTISSDEKRIATGNETRVYVWDAETQSLLKSFGSYDSQIAFSADNTQLITDNYSDVELWDIQKGTHVNVSDLNSFNAEHLRITSNNRLLMKLVGNPNRVRSIMLSLSGEMIFTPDVDIRSASDFIWLVLSEDGNTLAADNKTLITIYDLASNKALLQIPDSGYRITLNPNGHILALMKTVTSGDKQTSTISLWDATTGTLIAKRDQIIHPQPINPVIPQSANDLYDMKLSYDGRLLAAAYEDGSIRLWDMLANHEVAILKGHTSAVSSIEFSADGTKLYSASKDGTVRQWGLPD